MLKKSVFTAFFCSLLSIQILISAEDRSEKFNFFIESVRPFNFELTEHIKDSGEHKFLMERSLSMAEKRFAIHAIILSTSHFQHIGGNAHPLLTRIGKEFGNGFIKKVVENYFSLEHNKTEHHKKSGKISHLKTPENPVMDELTLPEVSLPIASSVDSCIDDIDDISLEECNLTNLILESYKNFNASKNSSFPHSPLKRKTFEELKQQGSVINLNFFDTQKKVAPFIRSSEARNALLHNWRKKTKELEIYLKNHLVGQDKSIEDFTSSIFIHYSKRLKEQFIYYMEEMNNTQIADIFKEEESPSSVILIGPSGTGKTEMVKLTAKFLSYPIGKASGANLTAAGYKGDDACDSIKQLLQNAKELSTDYKELAENWGMLFIDEVDKTSINGDQFREGAQTSLLTLVEGSQKTKIEEGEYFNSRKLFIIYAGAFSYLQKTFEDTQITHDDLIAYGLLPELVNRIHTIIKIRSLHKKDFLDYMVRPQISPLYRCLREESELSHLKINFSLASLEILSKHLESKKTSARNVYATLKNVITFSMTLYKKNEKILRGIFSINDECLKLLQEETSQNNLLDLFKRRKQKIDALDNIFDDSLKSLIDQIKSKSILNIMDISDLTPEKKAEFLKFLLDEQDLFKQNERKIKILTRILTVNEFIVSKFSSQQSYESAHYLSGYL